MQPVLLLSTNKMVRTNSGKAVLIANLYLLGIHKLEQLFFMELVIKTELTLV